MLMAYCISQKTVLGIWHIAQNPVWHMAYLIGNMHGPGPNLRLDLDGGVWTYQ
jgi:hypothetical protein